MAIDRTLKDPEVGGAGRAAPRSLRVLVFGNDALVTHPLPEHGTVVIGRGDDVEVRVDVPGVSRRHVAIHVGGVLRVEDLGSSNGTRVRGQLLNQGHSQPIEPGEAVELCSDVTFAVQRVERAVAARPRRLWTHGYFEARLEEECERAHQSGLGFAVLRVRGPTATTPALLDAFASLLASTDVLANYAPGEYEALLSGRSEDAARALGAQLSRASSAEVELAWFPRDGRDPESLIEAAGHAPRRPDPEAQAGPVLLDPQMERLHALARRVAASSISVLLLGETGSGKEVLAEVVHRHSPRAARPFLKLNCTALSETLLESELFGHERGAFTGAVKTKEGLLESANGGTVLLDEVGDMPAAVQGKLLRALEQQEVLRVGDVKPRKIDVRFLAATNRDLEAEVGKGSFRADLYFRLNGISLVVPPLRERPAEIEPLARHFAALAARQMKQPEPIFSPEAIAVLKGYRWPGNVRELRNFVERGVALGTNGRIEHEHLPLEKIHATLLPLPATPRSAEFDANRQRVLDALEKFAGNQTRAASHLGIARSTMHAWLELYGIPRPRKA